MKRLRLQISAGIILFFCQFIQAQTKFSIVGQGALIRDGDVMYLTYKKENKTVLDSTIVKHKKYNFKGTIDNIRTASIYRNQNPMTSEFVNESLKVYLEDGTINITSPDTLVGAKISGTPLNRTLQQLNDALIPVTNKRRLVKDPDFMSPQEKLDTAFVNTSRKQLMELYFERVNAELRFINANPGSYVSLELLTNVSRQSRFVDEIAFAYSKLPDSFKQTPQGETIRENITKSRKINIGMPAPRFAIADQQGQIVALSSFRGRYVLVDFWASWCKPCREEHPNLINAIHKYKSKGLEILSISTDTDKDAWLKAITQDHLTWTQLSDLKGSDGETALKYGINSIPANFLIDPEGKVIARDLKGHLLVEALEKLFAN